ncbi:PAS domain-containing protein [Polaribacter sp. R2A056_3_33]|uniref:PAS domain-containing protein n=1 Tax=Polaribacter sp. R2A056_3_33 TaxID=2745563 RepID=UPI001C4F4A66|nr:PAS domain-containing protein [Polaribacter sp. R2A056_3_33]QXP71560.1 PAS domain-containing protein [Polaribacter sp. R2A056_3_33]
MNYSQIAHLFMQGTLVALVILFLFHLRKQLGIGVMFACLGLFQFVQLFLYNTVSVSITDNFFVSPGSVVYFTASLFVILMVYIKEDASETKKLIYALFIVNIVMTILVQALNLNFNNTSIQGTFNASVNLFDISLRELFIGTVVLFLDAFLIILLFEYISKRVECLFLRICITMLIVVSFDTLFFVTLNFWGIDNLKSIIISGLISKGIFTVFYSVLLYLYLRFFDLNKQLTGVFKIKDVFEPLTYKQKFESAEKVIEETTEMYRILTDHSNDLIFLQEPDGAFKYISPSIKNILGYEQLDLVGKKVFSIVHKEDLKFLNEVVSNKLISKGIISEAVPVRVHHKEGHFVWLEFLSSAVYEGGEISYFVTSARDITQRVLSKKKLQDSLEELEKKEHSLEGASKVAKIGYWEYDIKTDTFTWSDYMYTIYGMDPVNGIPSKKELLSLYDEESQEKILQALKDVAVKGVSCDVELRFVNKQNEVVWERTVAQSIYNQQNEVVGRIGIMQDITAFKKAQFEEKLSKEKIQSSLELLEKKDYALNEVSRMAKIGYWEYNNEQVNIVWSDYHYEIFGFDPKKGIPPREKIVALFDEESQRKIVQVNLELNSSGAPYDIELKLTNKKKEEIWVRNIVQPVFDKQNKVIGRRGLLQNITTSKKAQLALELSNEKIQISLELLEKKDYSLNESSNLAKIGYWDYIAATDTYTWSDYIYHIYGLDPNEGIPPYEEVVKVCDKESIDKLLAATVELNTHGTPYNLVLKLINKNKEEVWVRNVAKPIYNKQNEIIGRRGVSQNISEWKKAQAELELSKEKIQSSLHLLEKRDHSLTESSRIAKIGHWEYDIATDAFVWSDYVYEIYGLDPSESIPSRKDMVAFYDKDSQLKLAKSTVDLSLKGTLYDIELKLINKKNKELWVRQVVHLIYNDKNEIIGRRGVVHNITAAKNAQIELEISKDEIQRSLELLESSEFSKNEASKMAKIGYIEYDIATETFSWSEYTYHIFGIDIKQPVPSRKEIAEFFDKESNEKMRDASLKLDTEGISFDIELKLTNLRKEEVWIRIAVEPVYNQQNKIIKRRGVLQDITASKNVQLELEISKENVQNSLELSRKSKFAMGEASKVAKIGYWEHDLLTDIVVWSEYVYHIFGLNPKNGIPSKVEFLESMTIESQEKFVQATTALTTKGVSYDLELKFNNIKDEVVWLRNVAQPVYNEKNEIVGKRGVLQNITGSKEAQQELELSKEKIENALKLLEKKEYSLRKASEIAKIGYQEYDNATDTFIWSDYVYDILRFDIKKGIPSREDVIAIFDDESVEKYTKATQELIKNGTPLDCELRLVTNDKEEVWVRNFGQPVYNKHNEIIGRRGVLQDITASKKAQFELEVSKKNIQTSLELLEKSEYSKNEASNLAKIGYLEYDNDTGTFVWSEFLFHIFGLDSKDPVPPLKDIINFLDKESQKKMKQVTLDLEQHGIPYDIELRLINKKKEEVWGRMIVQPLFNEEKEVIGRRGVFQDITERKQIEHENLIITERYRNLFDNATISVWNGDLSGVIKQLEELKKLKILDFRVYLEQHPEVFVSILKKVVINKVNKATVKLFKAKSEKEFLDGKMENTFGTGAHKVFAEFIISIWNKEKTFTSEVNYKTFKGDEFAALISIPIPLNLEQQKTVPVSIQSIQNIKDAESEKRESLNRLKEAQELAQVGSWSFDFSTKKSEWSDETFRIWGFDLNKPTPEQVDILNRIHKDDLDYFENAASLVYTKGIPYDIEFRICLPNNVEKTIRSICKPIFGENKEVVSLKGTNQDITAQKEARSEIEKAEEMYRILTDNSNDLICLHEVDSSFKYISPSIHNLLGYEQSELLGRKVFGIVHKEDIEPLLKVMSERTSSNMYTDAFSCRVLHKEGHYVWLEFLSSPVYKDNMINSYISSARDITQWVLAKQEIEVYQSSLQKLTTEMTLIEEKQKKEIATNIHDHLSQSLVISKMKINELKKRPQLKLIDEDLKFIETHISEALENSRKITYELSPPVLYQLGIIEALSWLFDNVEATHKIACVVNTNVDNINLDEVKSILLYRSIQEVLTNAIKYADASLITLDLDKNELGLDIFITDNGVGFNTAILSSLHNHSGSGFGLFTVQERIKNIQGKFAIKSKINMGTTVKIFIPLSK